PGNYTISIRDSLGCKKYYSFQLKEPNELNLKLEKEIIIKIGLNNTLNPIINFVPQSIVWSPTKGLSCSDCLNPVSNPTENITYDLTLTDSNGCSVSSRINVIVDFDAHIFVPNVFSPNRDLLNDFFQIVADQGIDFIELMEIFDRWGERVYYKTKFNANDKSEGWDGTFNGQKLNPAVFSYHIEARKRDGSTLSLFGDLTLVR
ncbi:MAG: gliding motility-associated C-terminal domain-containing protein, partial [Saprospiraceae bacterium]